MERPLPVPRAGEPLDEPGQVRRGDGPLKRIYFLVAVAVLQIIAGSLLLVGAALSALVGLLGGLAVVAASLMLSVWAWRRALSAPGPTSEPAPDPASDPASDPVADPAPDPTPDPPEAPQVPRDDNTRIY